MKSQLKLELKILLVVLVPFALFTTAILVNSYLHSISSIMEEKKLATKALVDTVYGTIYSNYKHYKNNPEEAKKAVIEEIESIRYGQEGKDYFFLFDNKPKMIMHPYSKHLIGKNIGGIADPTGKKLFKEMVEIAQSKGEGFVDYMWAWKGDKNNVLPKISYVKLFKEWNWIVGTGIYVQDAKDQAMSQVIGMFWMALIGFIIISVIIIFFTRTSVVRPIMQLSKKLTSISSSVLGASQEVADAGSKLAETTAEQASSIEETSASLEELTGMVENNVKSAEESNTISGAVGEVSEKGNQAMISLIQSMDEISANNENIQKFADVIALIAEKTQIIDEIVFQTKLLSFNASVEAERAGEHGRGFAVVAQEVGNLAQMSGKAALEISNIVKNSIKQAQTTASENKNKVEIGGRLVKETSQILEEIVGKAKSVSSSTIQIVQASREQEVGIKQINEAVGVLDRAIQINSTSSQETSDSSQELSDLVHDLDNTVNGLMLLVTGSTNKRPDALENKKIEIKPPAKKEAKKVLFKPKQEKALAKPKQKKQEKKAPSTSDTNKGWETL